MEVMSNLRHEKFIIWPNDIWRLPSRSKTVAAGILLCLHIGIDPPDTIKPNPCAKLEAWIDPTKLAPAKALESIGRNVQSQYEFWQPRARYRLGLDPTLDDAKKIIASLRKGAKDERVLLHYNGHGVPRPTANGELWVFNKQFTQYIPLSILDIHSWLGSPAIYVFDCPHAVNLVKALMDRLLKENEYESFDNEVFMIAASSLNETLPITPDMPADILTSCLTTPIEIALKWYLKQSSVLRKLPVEIAMKIPGKLGDRKTPLGELNWIFTAITDTIAWQILPKDLFKKLYRQDLLVASLFRNYLLAERIMKSYAVSPVTIPALPEAFKHPLWDSWDLAVDFCMGQMPDLMEGKEYQPSDFFTEHLECFRIWLSKGEAETTPPIQLPIILQTLLSQNHRLAALNLIGDFLDLGHWAIMEALNVGIFPYVLKLLQSPSNELLHVLLYIWTRIMAADFWAQTDLLKEDSYLYFVKCVSKSSDLKVSDEEQAMALLILSFFIYENTTSQGLLLRNGILNICMEGFESNCSSIRLWSLILIGNLVRNSFDYKWMIIKDVQLEKLQKMLYDSSPEVRTAAIYCLGSFFEGDYLGFSEEALNMEQILIIKILEKTDDGSELVRQELAICLSHFVKQNLNKFLMTAFELWEEEKHSSKRRTERIFTTTLSLYNSVWKTLLNLSVDPSDNVSSVAIQIVDDINAKFLLSQTKSMSKSPSSLFEKRRMTAPNLIFDEKPYLREAENVSEKSLPIPSNYSYSQQSLHPAALIPSSSDPQSVASYSSNFLKWAAITFITEQKARKKERQRMGDENDGTWKRKRVEKCKEELLFWDKIKTEKRLDEQVSLMDNGTDSVSICMFHPFDLALVVADEKSIIRVWNYEQGIPLNSFKNSNPKGTKVTCLKYLNEDSNPLLLTASNDGIVRIWKDFVSLSTNFVTGWKALDVIPNSEGVGMKLDFQKWNSKMFAAGDSSSIKIWDLNQEMVSQTLHSGSFSLTEMCSDASMPSFLFCGFSDGTIRAFDVRLPIAKACVKSFSEHDAYIVNIAKRSNSNLISGSVDGCIKMWDLRLLDSIKTIDSIAPSGMSALAIHPKLDILAAASYEQQIKVFTQDGTVLSTIRYHDGFLGQRLGPIASLNFHSNRTMLCAGSTDSIISVYCANRCKGYQ